MYRVRIVFRKGESARFLSHLDLMATFEYALRRARLPVELSEGFNPRPRMSAAAPLPLGYIGERELLEVELREELPHEVVGERLLAALPPGITILAVEGLPPGRKSAASQLASATYRVELLETGPDLQERVAILLSQERLVVEEQRDGTTRTRDIRALVLSIEADGAKAHLNIAVRLDGNGTARPEQILDLLRVPHEGARITRERIELRDGASRR